MSVNKLEAISCALGALLERNSVAELRVPHMHGRTLTGYFNDHSLLAKAACNLSGKAAGIYCTLNPVSPELLARTANRVTRDAQNATSDADVLLRRWLPLDLDPVRPSGISSTDAEHEATLNRARQCKDWLRAEGWPEPVVADSGNGGHLLYRIDLPNDRESTNLVKQCLQALGLRFTDDEVVVDLTTYNAARIWKIYGTLASKGDNMPDRPHRIATILEIPSPYGCCQSFASHKAGGNTPADSERTPQDQQLRLGRVGVSAQDSSCRPGCVEWRTQMDFKSVSLEF